MTPSRQALLGIASGLGLLGGILATQLDLWQQPGYCQQCDCVQMQLDDAGNPTGMRNVVLSFATNDKPDASADDRIWSACTVEANAACGTTGQAFVDLTPELQQCVLTQRQLCAASGMGQALACRYCTPAAACSQTEPVKAVGRAASDFNCACCIQQYDAGSCRWRDGPAHDGGLVQAPREQIIPHGLAIGTGAVRGIPCVEYEEAITGIGADLPRGYALPRECHPEVWDGGTP